MSEAADRGRMDAAAAEARRFIAEEAGFAHVTTIDRLGYPVTRTMTAFPLNGWAVATVQRALHRRLDQWRRRPQTEVLWIGGPKAGMTNEHPHVFDIDTLPPRLVSVRGDAAFMSPEATEEMYRRAITAQRNRGFTRAPLRSPEQVRTELVGVLIRPQIVRLEGFGEEAETFTCRPPRVDSITAGGQ